MQSKDYFGGACDLIFNLIQLCEHESEHLYQIEVMEDKRINPYGTQFAKEKITARDRDVYMAFHDDWAVEQDAYLTSAHNTENSLQRYFPESLDKIDPYKYAKGIELPLGRNLLNFDAGYDDPNLVFDDVPVNQVPTRFADLAIGGHPNPLIYLNDYPVLKREYNLDGSVKTQSQLGQDRDAWLTEHDKNGTLGDIVYAQNRQLSTEQAINEFYEHIRDSRM